MNRKYIFIFLLPIFFFAALQAHAWTGRVTGIEATDTISVVRLSDRKRFSIRLYGIMAPDITQLMGRKAKRLLASLAMGKKVKVDEKGTDHLGRTEGIIHIHRTTVNEQMVRKGMAWVDPLRCRSGECDLWKHQEVSARITKKGLWEKMKSENPQFEWHKKKGPPDEKTP